VVAIDPHTAPSTTDPDLGAQRSSYVEFHENVRPLRVFVEDVLRSDDFGPAGCFKSIGWAQYRPADGRAWRFRWRRRRLAAAARRLIPVAQTGWVTSGLGWWRHKLRWCLLPHGPVDPARWAAQVAIE
jgi:hypothetical protein